MKTLFNFLLFPVRMIALVGVAAGFLTVFLSTLLARGPDVAFAAITAAVAAAADAVE